MPSTATDSSDATFIADVAAELVARQPGLAAAITTTDTGLAVSASDGTIVVGQARFACVLGWAVAGPGGEGAWPAAGLDVDGVVTEVLRRLSSR